MFSILALLYIQFCQTDFPVGISLKQLHKAATVEPLYRRNTDSQRQTFKHSNTQSHISLGCSERYINLSNKQLNHLPLSMQCGCLLAITDSMLLPERPKWGWEWEWDRDFDAMSGWDGRNWKLEPNLRAPRRMAGRWPNSNGTETLPRLRIKIMQTRNKDDGQQAVGGGNGCVASFNRQMWQCHLLPKSAQPKKGAGVGA